jgi:hypothetical protein
MRSSTLSMYVSSAFITSDNFLYICFLATYCFIMFAMESNKTFPLIDSLAERNQWNALGQIANYLSDEERIRLGATCKAMQQVCSSEKWPAPGSRQLPCTRWDVDGRFYWRQGDKAKTLLRAATVCTVVALFALAISAPPHHTPSAQTWIPVMRVSPYVTILSILGAGLALAGYAYLESHDDHYSREALQFAHQTAQTSSGGLVHAHSFAELDERLDWNRAERQGLFNNSTIVAKAKFLHRRRQAVLQDPDLSPVGRKWRELQYNLEFQFVKSYGHDSRFTHSDAKYFLKTNSIANGWKEAADALSAARARWPWSEDRQKVVNERLDLLQYGRDRNWFEHWSMWRIGPLAREMAIVVDLGIALAGLIGVARARIAWLELKQQLAIAQPIALFCESAPKCAALALAFWFIHQMVYSKRPSTLQILDWVEAKVCRYVATFSPHAQYPQFNFETATFDEMDQTVDWQVVNRYGLMDRHLLQMAVAWSADLERAREANDPHDVQRITAEINEDFKRARQLFVR